MDGFINLLKPPGMTSSDAVLCVRRMLPRGTKVGHGGTLDPDAAGVLPICVGRATRLFDYVIDKEKQYIAEAALGSATDTQDASGRVLYARAVEAGEREIRAALPQLTGRIMQTPPAFSAIKQGGKRMYDLARQGAAVDIAARPVQVNRLDYLRESGYNRHMLGVTCGKGVYVRTLVHDMGEILGCGAHMSFLLRTRAGMFTVEDARTLHQLAQQNLEANLVRMDAPLEHLPQIRLPESLCRVVSAGNPVQDTAGLNIGTVVRVYLGQAFAGIGEANGSGMIRFRAMLL